MGEFGKFTSEDEARASVKDETRKMTEAERGQFFEGADKPGANPMDARIVNRIPRSAEDRATHVEHTEERDRKRV